MTFPWNKQASLRDAAVQRLRNVASDLDASGHWFRAGQLEHAADFVENPRSLRAAGSALGAGADVIQSAIKPGDSDAARYVIDNWVKTPTTAGLAVVGLAYPIGALRTFEENSVLGPLSEAQLRGDTPMTDPFHSFVQRRKHGHVAPMQKTAGGGQAIMGKMLNPLGEILSHLISAPVTDAAGKILNREGKLFDVAGGQIARQFSPGRAAITGAGALGLGALASMADPAMDTAAYQVQKMLFPAHERVQAEDEFMKNFVSQSGKNTANALHELLMGAVTGAVGSARAANTTFSQDAVFAKALETDPLLRDAGPQDRAMLQQAFGSMARFAPDVATDEFAVRNFLRESMLASNGPDYATLGNLARVNRALIGDPR